MTGDSTARPVEHLRLRAIDSQLQAEACRRTAVELAAHERDDHAIAQFERAREIDAGIHGIAHPLAVLYDRQGRMDAAEREYKKALVNAPKDANLLNDYGYFLYSRGDLAQAEPMLRHAIQLRPEHPKAALNLGMVLLGSGRFDEAFTQFETAVGPAAAHHNIGMGLMRQGRREEAIVHFRQAIKRDPSLTQTNAVLAQLESTQPSTNHEIEQASAEEDPIGRVEFAD